MRSPFTFTPQIVDLVAAISEKIGEADANHLIMLPAELRKSNRIRTIQATLGIDGRFLSADQIGAIIENKPTICPAEDMLEIRNALDVYYRLHQFGATKLSSLIRAHRLMMAERTKSPGMLRTRHVEMLDKDKPWYAILDAREARQFLTSLFEYLRNSTDPPLIKGCVFHYEFDLIHPFAEGNGRLGRLWQTIILMEHYPLMEFLPVETILWREKDRYFATLNKADFLGTSTSFIEFMLEAILESLKELLSGRFLAPTAAHRLERFKAEIGNRPFARKEYLGTYKNISTATASRDLRDGVKKEILTRTGDKRNTSYRFD
jgi:Fic family protein